MRLTRPEVDRLAGQTPCLCGSINGWHMVCFDGKTPKEVVTAYGRAYEIARLLLKQRGLVYANKIIDRIK